MKIGLYDVDSKIPNLALMKLSTWHKQKGDSVEFYSPLLNKTYDKIYASKIFTSSDKGYLRREMIIGGSGFDMYKELLHDVEHIYPDYDLYNCKYAMGFLTRGCIRKCPFCIVPEKEGRIRYNAPLEEFCKDQEEVMLLDNNFLAYENHDEILKHLIESNKKFDFNQGLDIRLINEINARLLKKLRIWKQLRFALDDPSLIPIVEKKLRILNKVGFKNKRFRFYVLVGYNTTKKEDLKRIEFLHQKGCDIFVMPYKKTNYTTKIARWVNRFFYKYESLDDYIHGIRT